MMVSRALGQMPGRADDRCDVEARALDGTCANFWIVGEIIGTLLRAEEFIEWKREARETLNVRCCAYGCRGQRKMTDD